MPDGGVHEADTSRDLGLYGSVVSLPFVAVAMGAGALFIFLVGELIEKETSLVIPHGELLEILVAGIEGDLGALVGAGLALVGLVPAALVFWWVTSHYASPYVRYDDTTLFVRRGVYWPRTFLFHIDELESVKVRQNLLMRLLGTRALRIKARLPTGRTKTLRLVGLNDPQQIAAALLGRRERRLHPEETTEVPFQPMEQVLQADAPPGPVKVEISDRLDGYVTTIIVPVLLVGFVTGLLVTRAIWFAALILTFLVIREHIFDLTYDDRHLTLHKGFYPRRTHIIPIDQIQEVRVYQTFLMRPFRVMGLSIRSPTTGKRLHVIGCPDPPGLRDLLLRKRERLRAQQANGA